MKRCVLAVTAAMVLAGAAPAFAESTDLRDGRNAAPVRAGDIAPAPGPAEAMAAPEMREHPLVAGWIDRLRQEAASVSEELAAPATLVSAGYTLRQGAFGPRVAELRQRLAELGYEAGADRGADTAADLGAEATAVDPRRFTAALAQTVERFQRDRGLFVDGLVGPQTLAELNRTPRDTIASLSWTIERMQELRTALPETVLLINIPSLEAKLVRDGEIVMDMEAAVGRPSRRTPLLVDEIVALVLNPRWTVPPTIMREDVLPRLRAEGSSGISYSTVMLDGEVVDPAEVDWSEVSPWQITVRQSAGNHNALGRYLFSLTNGQNIFVHDTNYHGVFQRPNRWVSSGCVRVSQARELAEYLATENGYTIAELDRALASGYTRGFRLDNPLPVYMTYWTATVGDDGDIAYHRDIYNRMRGYEPELSWAVTATEVEPGAVEADPAANGAAGPAAAGTES
ncbi:MAG: L,D-transpeptidase family protein [Alphaproteobacteria bacterium]|jgi:murein L,D-transpeptidase YcbB/YkuD|nr:L,D-transpeptidase family protein [Alphaproteobacteria bacterium]